MSEPAARVSVRVLRSRASERQTGTVERMDLSAIRNAVISYVETRDHPVMEERDKADRRLAVLLEDLVREHLDDEQLAKGLDGLNMRRVVSDGEGTLNISGAFHTLGMERGSRRRNTIRIQTPMLPMDAVLSIAPGAVSVVRVAGRESLFSAPRSERQFWRAFEAAVWNQSVELQLS